MSDYIFKAPSRFFLLVVGGGLVTGLLIFLAIQAMPVLGWILWIVAVVSAIAGTLIWYRGDNGGETESESGFTHTRQGEEDKRLHLSLHLNTSVRHRDAERNRTELRRQRAARRGELMQKYGHDRDMVERIVLGLHWQGQTVGQLKDALGNPADIAAKIVKGRRTETWKYHPTGGDRYALWITLEQDFVVRWEEKS